VVRLSQWFITLCLWLYCISITKKSDISQWFIMLCLWLYCISITKKSDTSISDLSRYVSDCTVSVSLRRVIRLSRYVSDCTIYMIVIILWSYYFICLSSMMLQSFCSYNCLCAITFVLVGWFFWIFFFISVTEYRLWLILRILTPAVSIQETQIKCAKKGVVCF
jgi:hypothetical protein